MLRAGDLRNRITIQRLAQNEDAWGQPLPAGWADVGKAWANIRNQSGLATIKAGAEISIVQTSIRVRYRADVLAGMRVLHGATVYMVRAVLPGEARREYLDLVCEVVT